ncbi:MAG TPA: hypothetical protein VF199_12815 [Bacillales bacterium]
MERLTQRLTTANQAIATLEEVFRIKNGQLSNAMQPFNVLSTALRLNGNWQNNFYVILRGLI